MRVWLCVFVFVRVAVVSRSYCAHSARKMCLCWCIWNVGRRHNASLSVFHDVDRRRHCLTRPTHPRASRPHRTTYTLNLSQQFQISFGTIADVLVRISLNTRHTSCTYMLEKQVYARLLSGSSVRPASTLLCSHVALVVFEPATEPHLAFLYRILFVTVRSVSESSLISFAPDSYTFKNRAKSLSN